MSSKISTTVYEDKWIAEFLALMSRRPPALWFFCNGQANIMKKRNGEKMHTPYGGVDPDYMVETETIPGFEGGDW